MKLFCLVQDVPPRSWIELSALWKMMTSISLVEWRWKRRREFSRKSGARTSTGRTLLPLNEWSRTYRTWSTTTSRTCLARAPTIIITTCRPWLAIFRLPTGSARTTKSTTIWINSRSSPACATISKPRRQSTACQAPQNRMFWAIRICRRTPPAASIFIHTSCQTLKK